MNPSAISLVNVSKRYGPKEIIKNISFEVMPGEILGFLGPNGAGKTTTIKMIAGTTTATSGTVSVKGLDMSTQQELGAKKIGYLPEHPPLYDVFQVKGYLHFIARAKKVPKKQVKQSLDQVISACKLEKVTKSEIYKLSKGYRQRLGLAQALIGDPEVLLLDEPTSGLDPGQIQETRDVIKQCGVKQSVLLSTHILTEVTLLCARVAIINEGKLLAIDTPSGLRQASEQSNRVSLLVSGNVENLKIALKEIDDIQKVDVFKQDKDKVLIVCHLNSNNDTENIIAKLATEKTKLYQLERHGPTLENVFLQYIKKGKNSKEKK